MFTYAILKAHIAVGQIYHCGNGDPDIDVMQLGQSLLVDNQAVWQGSIASTCAMQVHNKVGSQLLCQAPHLTLHALTVVIIGNTIAEELLVLENYQIQQGGSDGGCTR